MIPAPMENPFRRSHGTDRSEYRPSDHVLVLGAGRENPHATLHEFVHILEHCSTPYGFLLDELNFRQNLLIQEFLKAVDGPITVPIYNWAVTERKRVSSSATATEIFENLFKRFLQPWSICLHIVNAFEGKDNKYIRTSTIGEDATFLAVCEAVPGTATDLDAVDDVLVVELMEELASVLRLLSDARFRGQVVSRLTDPVVRGFWEQEFSNWRPQMQAEAIAPIQNKVGQFIAHPILREILGRPDSRIDIRQFMDESKVLIVNLSKGRIGEDASTLLGSLLVSQLQLAAMSQSDLPPEERTDFFAYVDEFQNFATESFATILSEARKYRLSLTVANQYLAQLDDATLHALFGNVGTLLTFQVGAKDAELLAEQLGGNIEPSDLMSLPKFTAYARLLIDGLPSRPFSMQTIVPRRSQDSGRIDVIRKTSRHRYGKRSV